MNREVPLTLEEIHKVTLEVIKKFIEVCDRINVNYYVAYGSLIGTIRHQGFIPWDDDFDVVMMRPDYDKLCEWCDEHAEELYPFRLMNRNNTKDYPYNISRFNDLRYRQVREDDVPDAGMGVFIDVYPYDGIKRNAVKTLQRKIKICMTMWDLSFRKRFLLNSENVLFAVLKLVLMPIAKLIGKDYFLNKMENNKLLCNYDESDYVFCVVWDNDTHAVPKRFFRSFKYENFEGIQVKIPVDYDSVLTMFYGDYMQLPPESDRQPHHGYSVYLR